MHRAALVAGAYCRGTVPHWRFGRYVMKFPELRVPIVCMTHARHRCQGSYQYMKPQPQALTPEHICHIIGGTGRHSNPPSLKATLKLISTFNKWRYIPQSL